MTRNKNFVGISLPGDEHAAVAALAQEAEVTVTTILRIGLRFTLGRHPRDIQRRAAELPPDGREFSGNAARPVGQPDTNSGS